MVRSDFVLNNLFISKKIWVEQVFINFVKYIYINYKLFIKLTLPGHSFFIGKLSDLFIVT